MSVGQLSGWVAQVGGKIDAVAESYITDTVAAFATALAPVALVAVTIYWMVLAMAIMRGELQSPVMAAIWRAIKVTLITSFALNSALFNAQIVELYDGLRDGVASTFATAAFTGTDPVVDASNVWDVIDAMSERNYVLLNTAAEDVSWYDLPGALALLVMDLGFLLLSLAAVFIAVIAKIFGTFFIGIGPLFILCLLFKPTQRFFDGWLGMILNTVVLTWIGMFATSFGCHVATEYARTLAEDWTVAVNPVTTSLQYTGICGILALLIYQAPSWAAALTGGSALQMGAQMARDVAGLTHDARPRGSGPAGGPSGGGGNRISRGSVLVGAGYAAGRGLRVAGNVFRRTAAYLRAARGRRG